MDCGLRRLLIPNLKCNGNDNGNAHDFTPIGMAMLLLNPTARPAKERKQDCTWPSGRCPEEGPTTTERQGEEKTERKVKGQRQQRQWRVVSQGIGNDVTLKRLGGRLQCPLPQHHSRINACMCICIRVPVCTQVLVLVLVPSEYYSSTQVRVRASMAIVQYSTRVRSYSSMYVCTLSVCACPTCT